MIKAFALIAKNYPDWQIVLQEMVKLMKEEF